MIVPGTMKLTFNISLSGNANKTLVQNLGRNIIKKLVVKLESNYDILHSYHDCWKSTTERRNAVFQGIVEAGGQTENAIKHRINAGDKTDVANGLGGRLTYELNFADYSDVIIIIKNQDLMQMHHTQFPTSPYNSIQ